MIKLYNLIMDSKHNPLSYIPDTNTRHLVMQILAWMWCIIFGMSVGSVTVFGISAIAHALLIAGVFIGGYLVVSVVGICYIIYKLFKDE